MSEEKTWLFHLIWGFLSLIEGSLMAYNDTYYFMKKHKLRIFVKKVTEKWKE